MTKPVPKIKTPKPNQEELTFSKLIGKCQPYITPFYTIAKGCWVGDLEKHKSAS